MRSLIITTLALGLTACASSQPAATNAVKADAVAWQGLDAVSQTLDVLARGRVIHGPIAKVIACDLDAAKDALTKADDAYGSGDTMTANQNAATASTLVVELTKIALAAKTGQPIEATQASGACLAKGA